MDFKGIKCVVLDLDDTLYPEKEFILGGLKAAAHCLSAFGLNEEQTFEEMRYSLEYESRFAIFDRFLSRYNMEMSLIPLLVDAYRKHEPNINLFNDARDFLENVHERYLLGLITDGMAQVQWNKIRALDIQRFFDIIVVTDEYGLNCAKPAEFPYKLVTEKLNICPEQAVYIGDNPYKDFITAKKLGWYTVRVNRSCGEYCHCFLDEEHEAQLMVKDLREVYKMLL